MLFPISLTAYTLNRYMAPGDKFLIVFSLIFAAAGRSLTLNQVVEVSMMKCLIVAYLFSATSHFSLAEKDLQSPSILTLYGAWGGPGKMGKI